MPDGDAGAVDAVGNDAAGLTVEALANRSRVSGEDAATGVVTCTRGAVGINDLSCKRLAGSDLGGSLQRCSLGVEFAAWPGMERNLIVLAVVSSLEEIDLSRVWPRGGSAEGPVSGPSTAAVRGSEEVGDEQAGVEGLFGRDSHGLALLARRELGGMVDADNGGVICLDEGETGLLGVIPSSELDKAVRWVLASEEVPLAAKIG